MNEQGVHDVLVRSADDRAGSRGFGHTCIMQIYRPARGSPKGCARIDEYIETSLQLNHLETDVAPQILHLDIVAPRNGPTVKVLCPQ